MFDPGEPIWFIVAKLFVIGVVLVVVPFLIMIFAPMPWAVVVVLLYFTVLGGLSVRTAKNL